MATPQVQFHNGRVLFNNGRVAMDPACCCVEDTVEGYCCTAAPRTLLDIIFSTLPHLDAQVFVLEFDDDNWRWYGELEIDGYTYSVKIWDYMAFFLGIADVVAAIGTWPQPEPDNPSAGGACYAIQMYEDGLAINGALFMTEAPDHTLCFPQDATHDVTDHTGNGSVTHLADGI